MGGLRVEGTGTLGRNGSAQDEGRRFYVLPDDESFDMKLPQRI